MRVDRSILSLYPEFLKDYFQNHALALDPELHLLWSNSDAVLNEAYLFLATEYGVSRMEKYLELSPKATDTLEDRQFIIQTILSQTQVITVRTLEEQLKALCGETGYRVEVIHANFILKVRIELAVKRQFDIVREMVNRIAPANLLIDVDLLYNTHEILSRFTHAQLSAWTHEHIRNEVLN